MSVALYVPGDRPDRFDKAVATGADVVILDWEDAVAADRKQVAREAVADWLRVRDAARPEPDLEAEVQVQVRIEAGSNADLETLAALLPGLRTPPSVRLPKVRRLKDVTRVHEALGVPVHGLIEDAAGLVALDAIATTSGLASLTLGESDLVADLGSTAPAVLEHARIRLVLACRAAGLPRPLMSAWPAVRDLDGLAADCAAGRALGFGGRTAIHPSQVPVIRRAFAPDAVEIAWAREVLTALGGTGVATLADGSMVDEAMAKRARNLAGGAFGVV